MSFSDFTKNDNKSIIWGLLQEGGVFNDIPNTYFENIKRLFESSIISMKPEFDIFFDKNDEGDDDYDKKASEMIVNSNKAVIKKMINELGKFKQPRKIQPPPPTQNQIPQVNVLPIPPRFGMISDSSNSVDSRGNSKKQKIEEIYRADDLQNHRMSELELRLKEKQEEMDTMLNNKKPTSIDFSDNKLNDNKLASDEMEKLLAHALSSRQRELEHMTMNTTLDKSKNAEEWITGSNDPVANALNASIAIKRSNDIKRPTEQNSTISKKNVSFNEENNEEILYEKDSANHTNNGTMSYRDTTENGTMSYRDTTENGTMSYRDTTENGNENGNLSFLSKLKRKSNVIHSDTSVDSIPLDDFMTDYDEGGEHGEREDDIIQLYVTEKTRDVRDSREYAKLDERINKIQTYIESIKQTQDKILELLQAK
jgi:hypothetical protein